MTEVLQILSEKHCLETTGGFLVYDYLVIATGSQANFFNFSQVKDKLMPLKTVPDALNLRSYILQNFESAVRMEDSEKQEGFINIAIVGGGPTGLELAGALGEMKNYILPKDYPELDVSRMRIVLYEAADRLLSAMSLNASKKAYEYLQKFGVEIHLNTLVAAYDGHLLEMEDGKSIHTHTVIWTAGVQGNLPDGVAENAITRGNRLRVNAFNQVEGYENIFALGDVAAMITENIPKGHPQLAPVAVQQAQRLGKNLLRKLKGQPLESFQYMDKGAMATIGRNKAVVDLPGWKFQGLFAWFVWMFVHIFTLIGFRNKLAAVWNWTYNYFTYDRAIRLIIRPFREAEVKASIGEDSSAGL